MNRIYQFSRISLWSLLLITLMACGATAQRPDNPQPPPATPTPAQAPTAAELSLPSVTPASPCVRQPVGEAISAAPNEGEEQPAGAPEVRYDGDSDTIVFSEGAATTLAVLSQALGRPKELREVSSGEWLLSAHLRIEQGASLRIAGPEVRWLKLRSDQQGFASIRAVGGQLQLSGTCISSWDEERGSADEEYEDGRSFLLAREGARLAIHASELRYLGYNANESFGLAWRLAGTSGEIVDSFVSHNYYGLYSYEVADLVIRGNEFHHNVLYGVDPHTRSVRLQIENNQVYNNGKHGIILADACSDSVVRGNTVYNNLHHGIVLYQNSDRNLVEHNTSYGNGAHGININQASSNIVRDNNVYDNAEVGIGVGQRASNNELIGNEIRGNRKDGVMLFSNVTDVTVRDNSISDNRRYGIYVKSEGGRFEGNEVWHNKVGVYFNLASRPQLAPQTNRIYNNEEADVLGAA